MACKTKKVYAPNGQESKLFKDLVSSFKDENSALETWSAIRTPAYKAIHGDWTSAEYSGDLKLDENGEPLFSSIVNDETLKDQEVYEQSLKMSQSYSQSVDSMNKYISNTRDILIRRIKELEDSDTKGTNIVKDRLVKLKQNLANLNWREAALAFSKTANSSVNYAATRIESELLKSEPNSRTLQRFNSTLTAFDILDNIMGTIESNDDIKAAFSEESIIEMEKIVRKKNGAKKKFRSYIENKTAKRLADASDGKFTEQEVKDLLNRAPFDISMQERWLRYAGDSKDSTIALVAKLINEQQQKTRKQSIEFTYELSKKLDAMENERSQFKGNPEKMYEPMLLKDSSGNFTGHFISPKLNKTAYAEFKAKYEGTKMFEFHEFFVNEYERLNEYIPMSANMGNRLPTLLKSTLEGIKSGDDKLSKVTNAVRDSISVSNTDTDKGQLLDDTNQPINGVPVHFTQRYDTAVFNAQYRKLTKQGVPKEKAQVQAMEFAVKELPKTISYDMASSLQAFQYMAENYANMNEIIDVVEGAKEMLKTRSVTVTDTKGNPIVTKMKDFTGDSITDNAQTKEGAESNAYKMLESLIAAQVYGQTEIDLGSFSIGNLHMDKKKLAKLIQKYNSSLLMGLNVLAGTSNILMGETMQWADAFGGEFYTVKDYLKAKAEYTKAIPSILGDVAERTPKSLINLLNEFYDILGDYYPGGVDATESSAMRRIWKSSSIFFISSSGEHKMQSQAAIAIMMNTKVYDKAGNSKGNLYDAHKAVDGKLVIEEVYVKDKEGKLVKYDTKQQNAVSMRTQALLRRMHGNYNKQTAAAWQRNALFQLIGQFRKWIADGAARRFDKSYYNVALGQEIEGNYRSTGKFMAALIKDLTQMEFDVAANWSELTNHEKANVKRTATEVAMVVAMSLSLYALGALAKGLDDEKDKNKLAVIRFMQYNANRLMSELMFYTIVTGDTWQILKTPAASMSVIETTIKTLTHALPWNWDERYESGIHKDMSKFYVSLRKQIPVWKQVERLTPDGLKNQVEMFNMY